MSPNGQIEVLIEVQLVDKRLLFAEDWKQDIFDTDLELRCIDIAEVLLEAFEAQINLIVLLVRQM